MWLVKWEGEGTLSLLEKGEKRKDREGPHSDGRGRKVNIELFSEETEKNL